MIEVTVVNLDAPEAIMSLLNAKHYKNIIAQIAEAARNEWVRLAGERLSSTRKDYIDAIQAVDLQEDLAIVALLGDFAVKIEQGSDGWDMRDTHLSEDAPTQDTIRTSKTGARYRHIPFRHQTPGSRGTAGPAMGSSYGFSGPGSLAGPHAVVGNVAALGKAVAAAARRLQPGQSLRAGIPGQFGQVRAGGSLKASQVAGGKLRPHHVTDIYAGMRVQLQPIIGKRTGLQTGTQRTYVTYRTISEDNPTGWMHPGIQAHNIADDVIDYAVGLAPRAFSAYVKALAR